MAIRTPLQQHERKHTRPDVEMGDCWECQRERAQCRSKVRYPDVEAAVAESIRINVLKEWEWRLTPYPCPWCCSYHLTSAEPGTARWKRVEKRRRKWLIEQQATA